MSDTVYNFNDFMNINLLFLRSFLYIILHFLECDTPVELGFLVDRSGSISQQNFEKVKSFILTVISGFDVSQNGTHVGIITYSSDAKTIISFDQFEDPNFDLKKLNDTIRDGLATPEGGRTRIDLALAKADQELFSDTTKYRSFVPKVGFFWNDCTSSMVSTRKK